MEVTEGEKAIKALESRLRGNDGAVIADVVGTAEEEDSCGGER